MARVHLPPSLLAHQWRLFQLPIDRNGAQQKGQPRFCHGLVWH